MPAYNFQDHFVSKILDKSKPHTIRRRRKRPTVPGDMLSLYTGLRTKNCKLIATATCVNVEPCLIKPALEQFWIWSDEQPGDLYYSEYETIGSYRLFKREEINALALKDGFLNASQFFAFFKLYKEDVLDNFEIVHWHTNLLKPNIENPDIARDERREMVPLKP